MTLSIGIVGGGVSGLTTAYYLRSHLNTANVDHTLTIYDARKRPGGSIYSKRIDGFLLEWGPNGFLNNEPATLKLVDDLDLRDRLLVSNDASRKRFLLINGTLMEVPAKPPGFIKTGILPFTAKMRFALEPFMGRSREDDESVASFVSRRFGKQAVTRMFDPLMSGIYAGDVNKLSVKSTFTVFSEMEEEYGSVVRGMFKKLKQRKAEEKEARESGSDDPLLTRSKNPMAGKLLSFQDGMGELTERLSSVLGDHIHYEATVESVSALENGYRIAGQAGDQSLKADHDILVLSTPPPAAGRLLQNQDAELAGVLAQIQSSTIAVVGLGFEADDIADPLDGFGYLIPRSEGKRSLGVLWSSSIFEHRAPYNSKLLTVMIGGAHDLEAINLSDEELIDIAVTETDPQLGIKGKPVMTRVIRHQSGIPQYNVGHGKRLAAIKQRLEHLPGLHLAGNGYYGISANDCIRNAATLARTIAENLRQ